MNTLPSAQFRNTYAKLTEATYVTANGHMIGLWSPEVHEALRPKSASTDPVPAPKTRPETPQEHQRRIDKILRAANG